MTHNCRIGGAQSGTDRATTSDCIQALGLSMIDLRSSKSVASKLCNAKSAVVCQQPKSEKQTLTATVWTRPSRNCFPQYPSASASLNPSKPLCLGTCRCSTLRFWRSTCVQFQLGSQSTVTIFDAFSILRFEKPTIVNILSAFML